VVEERDKAPPALWEHCKKVYTAMETGLFITEEGARVWEGYTSKLFASLGISVPYYGRVLSALTRMGCITQLRRGGGTAPSQWRLWKDPVLEEFLKTVEEIPGRQKRETLLESQVGDIRKQLGGVDIPQAIAALAGQIVQLDDRLSSLEEVTYGQPDVAREGS
jgi:hypothetical protein